MGYGRLNPILRSSVKRPLIALAAACLALPLVLSACGSSSSDTSSSAASTADPDAAAKQVLLDKLVTDAEAQGIETATAECVRDGVSDWTLAEMTEADSGTMSDELQTKWLAALAACGVEAASPAAS